MSDYFLLGKKLPHTFSPEIHARFGYAYASQELSTEEDVKEFLLKKEFKGLNVTIPYKETVIPFLDEISEEADAAGSVNTIVNRGGRLCGYNTDISGMRLALRTAGIALKGKRVLILGSGGTGKTAIRVAALEKAFSVNTVSRSGEVNYDNCYDQTDTQVIINATPVGMFPKTEGLPIDVTKFPKLESVFDAIYNPLETRLIQAARNSGLKAVGGLVMLVAQAKLSRDIFLGNTLAEAEINEIVADIVKEKRNIVLIGMAGAGKTSVGEGVAALLKMPFIDTDKEIEKRLKKTVPEVFAESGEGFFREQESAVCREAGARFKQVISTGGGAVLNPVTAELLKANGFVIEVQRDASKLPTDGRPLSKGTKSLSEMYLLRKPYYDKISDVSVLNNGSLEATIKEVIEQYEKHFGY